MRKSFSCIPIAAIIIAGSALAQTAQPDTSRNATPTAPDSSRNSQRCTTTGLSADAAARCPDDVLKDAMPPGAPQVVAPPAGGATGSVGVGTTSTGSMGAGTAGPGSSGTPAPSSGVSAIGAAPAPANMGGAARASPGR